MFWKDQQKMETIIGAETGIKGELKAKGTVRIDGMLEGDVHADSVIVGETGRIKGDIHSRGVVVGGRVDGNIDSKEMVELKAKAKVYGKISTGKLVVSEGAVFEGQSCMGEKRPATQSSETPVVSLKPTDLQAKGR